MNEFIVVLGALILVASVFGYSYAEDQQGVAESVEGFLQGDSTDWSIVSSLSLAGIALGVIIVLVGLIPDSYYPENS